MFNTNERQLITMEDGTEIVGQVLDVDDIGDVDEPHIVGIVPVLNTFANVEYCGQNFWNFVFWDGE